MANRIEINKDAYNLMQKDMAVCIHALQHAKRMIDIALPKFNWGDSCLDAEAITLLNEVPIEINAALKQVGGL